MSGKATEKRKTQRHSKRFHVAIGNNYYHGLDISNVGFSFFVPSKGSVIIPRGQAISVSIIYCHDGVKRSYQIVNCLVANMTITRDEKQQESSIYGISIKSMPSDISQQHYQLVNNISPNAYCTQAEIVSNTLKDLTPTPEPSKAPRVANYRVDSIKLILQDLEVQTVNEHLSDEKFRAHALTQIHEMMALLRI
jgi:hypothetical protein